MKKPVLIVMVGLSASGKSSIAQELSQKEGYTIISSDTIRGEICPGGVEDQSMNEKVFKIFHRRIKENLLAGKDVIADATNIKIKSRAAILNAVKDINCIKYAWVTTKQFEDCLKDNIGRKHPVPESVIKKQMYGFQIPFKEEGFDDVAFVDNNSAGNEYFEWYLRYKMYNFDQKNPHHKDTLWKHSVNTHKLFAGTWYKCNYESYYFGSKYHDIGKLFTQTFDDEGIAHYYSHENVGAYYMLSHLNDLKESCDWLTKEELINGIFLINYHMMPFNWNSQKAHDKWKKIFGEFKYAMLLKFHQCDKAR